MILDARPLVEQKVAQLKKITDKMINKPKLVIIRVGEDSASAKYVNNKVKLCERVGIESKVVHFPDTVGEYEILREIEKCNGSRRVSAVLLQLPLPKHLDEKRLTEAIKPNVDADGFTAENLGKLMLGEDAPRACTPAGIMELLDYYNIELEGKDVLIVNRSNIVGKPLALMMLEKNATVTIAHSKTRDLKEKCKKADVVVTAVGKANFMDEMWFNDNSVVVDVSINFDENGKMCGDVRKDDYEHINMITPVPFGVGQTTVMALIEQTIWMHVKESTRW